MECPQSIEIDQGSLVERGKEINLKKRKLIIKEKQNLMNELTRDSHLKDLIDFKLKLKRGKIIVMCQALEII